MPVCFTNATFLECIENMITIVLAILWLVLLLVYNTWRPRGYPPGPPFLPFVGNQPLVKKLSTALRGQHHAFIEISKRYSSKVIGLKLANELVVVVIDPDLIKHVLRSDEYNARPDSFFIRLRTMGTKKGITCTEGHFWTIQRNFLVRHLRNLGFGKQSMDKMIAEETHDIINLLAEEKTGITFRNVLSPSVLNILWAFVAGTRIKREDPRLVKLLKLLDVRTKVFDIAGGKLSLFPWLRFVAPEKSGYNLIVEINKELKAFFMDAIKEHQCKWKRGRQDDVMYSFLTEMENCKDDPNSTFSIDQLVMMCLDIFFGGAITTSSTVDFAILMMVLHPDIQRKVHEALDNAFITGKLPEYNDRQSVPYVEAVLREVERYCHVAPIGGPRRTLEETTIDGYRIPKGTTVLLSSYSLNRSVDIWGDPEVFRPGRFLDKNNEVIKNENLIPFSIGKRRCIAEALARNCIFTFFTGLMKTYRVELHKDSPEPTEVPIPGITLSPSPYRAVFIKRQKYC